MASYFVASSPVTAGSPAVHDRGRCPPGLFPDGAEYLGEFLDEKQATAVARLRYAHATPCACCARPALAANDSRPLTVLPS